MDLGHATTTLTQGATNRADMGKKKMPEKLRIWIDARTRFRLSDAHIQMARELGLNPKKFGKLDNRDQEPWKTPLPDFIESLYFKRFGKSGPDHVRSIEDIVRDQTKKKTERKARKQEQRGGLDNSSTAAEDS